MTAPMTGANIIPSMYCRPPCRPQGAGPEGPLRPARSTRLRGAAPASAARPPLLSWGPGGGPSRRRGAPAMAAGPCAARRAAPGSHPGP